MPKVVRAACRDPAMRLPPWKPALHLKVDRAAYDQRRPSIPRRMCSYCRCLRGSTSSPSNQRRRSQALERGRQTLCSRLCKFSLAPGVPSDSVEYMSGLRTDGAWLFDANDLLIAKVKVDGAADPDYLLFSAPGLAALAARSRADGRASPERTASRLPSSPCRSSMAARRLGGPLSR